MYPQSNDQIDELKNEAYRFIFSDFWDGIRKIKQVDAVLNCVGS